MKKVVFILAVIVLAGGAWYMNNNSTSTSFNKGNFDKALQIMQNLQSAAIVPNALTESDLEILEKAYEDAKKRRPEIEAFRETDRTALASLLTTNGITGSQANAINDLANKTKPDDYNSKIETQMKSLKDAYNSVSDTEIANIRKLTDSINSLSNDIRLQIDFIDKYTSQRPNICLTSDPKNDRYKKGTITFKYDTAKTAVIESCTNNTTLSAHYCSGLTYTTDNTHDKSIECDFGCNNGACNKGSLSAVSVVNSGSSGATTITDVKTNQQFWLKVNANRLHRARATANTNGTVATIESTGMGYTSAPIVTINGGTCTTRPTGRATVVDGYVTEVKLIGAIGCTGAPTISIAEPPATTGQNAPMKVTLTSPSLGTKCIYTGDSQYLNTGSTDTFFGPITCSTAEAHNFSLNLIEGSSTTPITSATKTVDVGGTSMSNFTITAPSKVAAGNNFSITVKAVGTNGLPYVGYTGSFFIIVDGDDEATFPGAAQTIPSGQSEITIPNIKFSKGGIIKITVRGTGVTDTADKTISVTGGKLSIKKNNDSDFSYDDGVTFNAGDTITYRWESVNGTSASSSYTTVKASGGTCGNDTVWVANSLNGTSGPHTLSAAHRGCTYTLTYKVKNNTITNNPTGSDTAIDTLTFIVNE